MPDPQLPSRLAEAIRAYVGRRERNHPVSVSRLVSAARSLMPTSAIGDNELVDLVTRELVLAGANVDFDTRRGETLAAPSPPRSRAEPAQPLIVREVMPLRMKWRRIRNRRGVQL